MWKSLQNDYDTFIMIADVQALTDHFDNPKKVRSGVSEVTKDLIACGIDPERVTIFIQSLISEIAELTVFYSNLVTLSRLQRNPTVKQEISDKGHIFKDGNVTYGFLGYPISQAADITFCRANLVPVGDDQLPMIEQTREIVEKFNRMYGDVFPLPEAKVTEMSRLRGLDGRKMSKSFRNAIYLIDSADDVREKIKKAKTDSETDVRYDLERKPDISNLMTYYKIATGKEYEEIQNEFKGSKSYASFKEKLAEAIISFLEPIQERRRKYEQDASLVEEILRAGTKRAKAEAQKTMELVRSRMNIDYFSRQRT